ncbi:MAG: hypothetical protein ACK4MS_15315 [Paracoccaceae bacterium]
MTRVLLVGHSHLTCIRQAFDQRGGQIEGLELEFAQLADAGFVPNLGPAGDVHPLLRQLVTAPRFAAIVSIIGGNAHFSLGLTNNPRRYDFISPEAPDLPLEDGAEIIPYWLVMRHLIGMSHETTPVLPAIRALAPRIPFLHLESPPPVPAENVSRHAKHFAPFIKHYGLSRPERVLRFWRLQGKMMKDICDQTGITYLPAPASMVDAEGLLQRVAWRDDPTHAGPAYGHAVLDQLAAHFAQRNAA